MWESLLAADIALVPSRVESFGNSAVEAMLACRPVVVADIQGLREIVLDQGHGEGARAGDATELAAAVLRVVDDWEVHVEGAIAAERYARDRFSPDRYRADVVARVGSSRAGSGVTVEGTGAIRA